MSQETPTVEERISALREQGKKDKDIVRQLFQEKLDTNVSEICRITGMDKLAVGRIKGQVSRWHKRRQEKEKDKGEPPTLYKTEPDANAILEEILETHPDIHEKVKNEVMDWARRRGSLDPGFVAWVLSNMRTVSATTANIVSQKYAFALQKAQMEGQVKVPYPFYSPVPSQQWTTPFIGPGMGTPQGYPPQAFQPPQGFYPQQPTLPPGGRPPYYTPQFPYGPQQDVSKIVTEKVDEVKKHLDQKLEEMKPPEERYIYIEEPLRNTEGKIIVDEKGKAFVKRLRIPASQAGQYAMGGDPEARVLQKLESYKKLFKEDITLEKVRAVVKEEAGEKSKEPPITKEDVEKSAVKAAETVLAKKAEEDKDERRHQEVIDAITRSRGSEVVKGYTSDSYRFLGQSMEHLATVIEKKEPIKVIIKGARDMLSEGPPPKEVEKGAKEGIEKHVKPEYVVER